MTNTTRLAIVALTVLTAVACNAKDVSNRNPLAPSTVSVAPPPATSTSNAEPSAVRSVSGQPPGTCVPATGYIRCWHFRPTLVLWVSPNARWARGGTPFVHYLRSGFKVHCDKTIVWSGGRRVYRVSPMRPVTIDGTRYACS